MSKKYLPSLSELKKRYSPLLHNREIEKVRNWSLPNCSDGFEEEKNLQFMQEDNQNFFETSINILGISPKDG
jgi:hypothetical protein